MKKLLRWIAVLSIGAVVLAGVRGRAIDERLGAGASQAVAVGGFIIFMSIVMGLAFGPSVLNARRNAAVRRRLRDHGVAFEAPIVRVVDTGVTNGNDPVVKITVTTEGDTTATFQTPVSRVAVPRPGDKIHVLYDRNDPSVAVKAW